MYGISSGICEADKIKNTCLQSCFDNTHPGVYSHAGMLTQPKTKLSRHGSSWFAAVTAAFQ